MKRFFQKPSFGNSLFGVFFLFVLFFTFFRIQIGSVAAWMLGMTNEITITAEDENNDSAGTNQLKKLKNIKKIKKKKYTITNPGPAQTTKRPKTKQPILVFSKEPLSFEDKSLPLLPKLRRKDGTKWKGEDTDIKMYTNGEQLFLQAKFYDKHPDKAITSNSKRAARASWRDDSIEIFLMKNKYSKLYCHYVLSVSGISYNAYLEPKKIYSRRRNKTKPIDFIEPEFSVEKNADHFLLNITIDLSNIGILDIKPGDTFLIQIVRNYRGKKEDLQLFPTYIYADNRFGALNHDRRAFQPVKIIDKKVDSSSEKDAE